MKTTVSIFMEKDSKKTEKKIRYAKTTIDNKHKARHDL